MMCGLLSDIYLTLKSCKTCKNEPQILYVKITYYVEIEHVEQQN